MPSRAWLFGLICVCAAVWLVSVAVHDLPGVSDRTRAAQRALDAAIARAADSVGLRAPPAALGRTVVAVTENSLEETLNWLVFAAHALPLGSGVTVATPDEAFAAQLSERGIESFYRGPRPVGRSRFWAWVRRAEPACLTRCRG